MEHTITAAKEASAVQNLDIKALQEKLTHTRQALSLESQAAAP